MKVQVIQSFIDKETGEPFNFGDMYESTDKDRIEELRDAGFLATNAEGKTKTPDASNDKPPAEPSNDGKPGEPPENGAE